MKAKVRLEPADDQDDRDGSRYRLLLDASGERDRDELIDIAINDLSTTGLLLQTDADLPHQSEIVIDLPGAGTIMAKIVWSSGSFHGAQFAVPLSEAFVEAALRQSKVVWLPSSNAQSDRTLRDVSQSADCDAKAPLEEVGNDRLEGLSIAVRIQLIIGLSLLLWLAAAYVMWTLRA